MTLVSRCTLPALTESALIRESIDRTVKVTNIMAFTMKTISMQSQMAAPTRSSVPVSAVLHAMPMPVRSVRLGSSSQSIGCVTRSLTAQRRSVALRASRSTPAVLVMASEKGFKVSMQFREYLYRRFTRICEHPIYSLHHHSRPQYFLPLPLQMHVSIIYRNLRGNSK